MSEPVTFALWAIILGALLISMVLSGSLLKRLPLSTAMLYLAIGIALGPAGWELLRPNPLAGKAGHPIIQSRDQFARRLASAQLRNNTLPIIK